MEGDTALGEETNIPRSLEEMADITSVSIQGVHNKGALEGNTFLYLNLFIEGEP